MRVTEPYTIFARTLKSGKVVYYYQFRDENGKRSAMRSTGCTTLPKAKRVCQKLFNEGGFSVGGSRRFGKFAEDFFSKEGEWYKWKATNGIAVSDSTLMSYVKLLKHQVMPYFGDMKLESISTATVKQWIVWVSDRWSPKTSNNAQSVLNIIMKVALEKGYVKNNPSQNLTFRKVQKKDRELLTVEEIKRIYGSPLWGDSAHRKAFLLAAVTGMRIGEVIALRGEDVLDGCLNVRHSYSVKFGLGPTKTRVNRYIPLPEGFLLKEDGWMFKSEVTKGNPLSAHGVYMIFRKVCDSLGIDTKGRGLTIHSLRNFFISYLQGKNVPLQKIKAVVGHADESMTDWYTYWTPSMFSEVYEEQKRLYDYITGA